MPFEEFETFFQSLLDARSESCPSLVFLPISLVTHFDKLLIKLNLGKKLRDFLGGSLRTHIALVFLTFPFAIGAVVIYKTFFLHRCQKTIANMTAHKSSQWEKTFVITALPFPVHNLLSLVKKCLGNNRLMNTNIMLAVIPDCAVVKWIPQHDMDPAFKYFFPAPRTKTFFVEYLRNFFGTVCSGRIQLERSLYVGCSFGVNHKCMRGNIIEITNLGETRIAAFFEFGF